MEAIWKKPSNGSTIFGRIKKKKERKEAIKKRVEREIGALKSLENMSKGTVSVDFLQHASTFPMHAHKSKLFFC